MLGQSPQIFRPYTIDTGTYLIAPEGLLCSELVVGAGAAEVDIQDPPQGHMPIFAADDIVRIRAQGYVQNSSQGDSAAAIAHEFWAVGDIPSTALLDVWLQVTTVTDLNTHFQYAVTRLSPSSTDQYTFMVNTLVMGYGPADNQLIRLRATRERTPQVDIFTTGDEPWVGSETHVRLGRLDDLEAINGEQYGLAAGESLNTANSMYVRVSEQGIHLSQLDLSLDDGNANTARLESTGAFTLGPDINDPDSIDLAYDPTTRTVTMRAAQIEDVEIINGSIRLTNVDTPTVEINGSGNVQFGTDLGQSDGVLFDLQAGAGTLAISAYTTLQGGVTLQGDSVSHGALRFQADDTVKVQIDSTGGFKLGPDISDPNSIDLEYDSTTRRVQIRNAQLLDSELSGSTRIVDATAHKITMSSGYTPSADQDVARWVDVADKLSRHSGGHMYAPMDMNGNLVKNMVSFPPTQTNNRDFIGVAYPRSVTTNAAIKGSVIVSTTGPGNLPSHPFALVDGQPTIYEISGTTIETTQIQIIIDIGDFVNVYSHALWFPYMSYRRVNAIFTWYNNVFVEVSANKIDWYTSQNISDWSTVDFGADCVDDSLWIGRNGHPPIPGYSWRYARFTLTNRREAPTYSHNASVWITQIGVSHISHEFLPQYAKANSPTIYSPKFKGLSSSPGASGRLYTNGDGIVRISP